MFPRVASYLAVSKVSVYTTPRPPSSSSFSSRLKRGCDYKLYLSAFPRPVGHVGGLALVFKKHFKCNRAAVSEFSNFDVVRLQIYLCNL